MNYLQTILEGLVNSPEKIEISESRDDMGILYSVRVADEDTGKVIGRNGNTARAIRLLMDHFGLKNRQKISIKILDKTA